ncbi:MAG: right-handed parallel beta-helix repeat-containing protein [Acidobacteriota bacterium]|nr:right-handed parallel beta-helix repeat-containing protein [Acidobacteriota bacterium]
MKTLRLFLLVFAVDLSAATITVNGTGDAISVDGACTLREAVTAANTNAVSGDCPAGSAGLDQIHFAIGGGGAQAISLFSPMPDIVDPVTIDATTQPGYAGTPLIEVAGSYIESTSILVVQMAGGGSTFRGLILRAIFGQPAIELRSSGNTVAANYFGTNGTTISDLLYVGVFIVGTVGAPASNNVIGGAAAADRNLFGAFSGVGVSVVAVSGAIADANSILGNDFGWNAAKTAALGGLLEGISVTRATNTEIRANSIVGSIVRGINIVLASDTVVQSNEIGRMGFGNQTGIWIDSSTDTIVGAATSGGPGGNVIVANGSGNPEGAGVIIFSSDSLGNRISGNSMSFNGSPPPGIGIDLFPYGPTANDACDPDAGPNALLNKPVLTSAVAVVADGTVIVDGSLNSTASASYTIELYANPPGSGDQGHQYIGSAAVMTDVGCNATFTSTIAFVPPADDWTITATAIDGANNTSEMSIPGIIVELDAPAVSKQFNPASVTVGNATQLTITLTNPNALAITGTAFTDNYPTGLVNAPVPNVTNTCGGTATALAGGSTLTLTGGSIPANGSCSVSVSVIPGTMGSSVNTLPAGSVTSANAPPSDAAASATLTVSAPAEAANVPLSPAALMLLAIALSMVGAIMLRQIGSGG